MNMKITLRYYFSSSDCAKPKSLTTESDGKQAFLYIAGGNAFLYIAGGNI